MNSEKDIPEFQNKNGKFDVPENYFTSLENDVWQSIQDDQIPFPSGEFNTPDGYFESTETEILQLVRKSGKSRVLKFGYWLAAAASVALLFSVFYLIPEKECETFTCMLQKTEFETEDLLFIDEEIIAEYYLELEESAEYNEGLTVVDSTEVIITDELHEEILESLDEEDIIEHFDL